MSRGPIIQTEVEQLMAVLGRELEEGTEQYAKIIEERAVAEADYKERYHTALVRQAETPYDTVKYTAAQKEARAALVAKEELRRFKLLEAREKAAQQFLISIRARLDSLRTMAANVRASGG